MNITQLIGFTGLLAVTSTTFAQSSYPDAIKVPDGHKIAMETTGVGEDHLRMPRQSQRCRADRVDVCRPESGAQ